LVSFYFLGMSVSKKVIDNFNLLRSECEVIFNFVFIKKVVESNGPVSVSFAHTDDFFVEVVKNRSVHIALPSRFKEAIKNMKFI